jgi:hypothetical protein
MEILRKLKSWWMAFVDVLGRIQTTLLLIIVYHLSVGPLGLGCRLLRRDLLGLRPGAGDSYAQRLPPVSSTMERARKQY